MLDAGHEPSISVKVQCRNDLCNLLINKEKKFKAYIINMRDTYTTIKYKQYFNF